MLFESNFALKLVCVGGSPSQLSATQHGPLLAVIVVIVVIIHFAIAKKLWSYYDNLHV
jgi:hypothetical protein